MSNSWKVSPLQATESGMMTMLGLLKWKTDTEMYERPGRPDVTSF